LQRKSKHTFYIQQLFFRKSHRLWDNVEKYGEARGATDDVTIWRIPVACWISKATRTRTHAHTHVPGHTHTRARVYTHKQVRNTYCLSSATMFRERASVLRYTYIACLLIIVSGLFAITSLSVCTSWFHKSHLRFHILAWVCVCACACHFSVVSIPSALHID
jgi:hypothetical protein